MGQCEYLMEKQHKEELLMYITCLDLEGVLVPEIWIAFAEASGIPELKRTTRDEPDYDKLMNWRLGILKEHGLGLKEIQETIEKIDPLPGAKEFLDKLRDLGQVIIISDTFTQFAKPLMKKARLADDLLQFSGSCPGRGDHGLSYADRKVQVYDSEGTSIHRI